MDANSFFMQGLPMPENADENTFFTHATLPALPAVRAIPGALTSSGAAKNIVLIKSVELAPTLQRWLQAGVRRVEVTAWVEGTTLTFKAAIVRRGPQHPLHLHPLGPAGQFLAELYRRRRAASGRRHYPLPILLISVVPVVEHEVNVKAGGA